MEAAPPPSVALLGEHREGDQWEGFWSADSDGYYVRRTQQDGPTEWYQVVDDEANTPVSVDARVLEFRPQPRAQHRVAVIVARSPGGRRMLVGTARRAAR